MFKELSKYVVIGIAAGIVAYLFTSKESISINVSNHGQGEVITSSNSYNDIYKSVKDSVVTINTDRGRGSGVIITDQGHIVTNEHVIKGAKNIRIITSDNISYPANVVGVDRITDIALLKSSYIGRALTFSDSSKVKIGDIVLAIGNPFGVGQTLTQGIISRTNSGHITANPLDEFLQSDAAINPGNSGGAMVNLSGDLIGINTMNVSIGGGSDGIGLAVPSNLVRKIAEQIIKYGRAVRGYVGLSAFDTSDGVLITNVVDGGPAYSSGLKNNDVIITINNSNIDNIKQVVKIVASLEVGEEISVVFRRNGELMKSIIKVAAMPETHRTIGR
jgi:S1-C subfamily serine protease